ncbi:MAG TPA: glycosyltransferase 87 family protein [Mycobacteriales bacterium]|nr:glycosyltransferase 87 family protein [Mycobacteriales bacterium]
MPNPPTREDPAAAGASELIGGPFGRHALGPSSRWWTPLRVALGITILVCLAGYLQKSQCLTHPYTDDYQYTRLCYTDTYVLYTAEGLNARTDNAGNVTGSVGVPYRDHPVEYPPIIGGLMWFAAEVTSVVHGGGADPSGSRATTFFNVTALGLAALALVSTFTIAQLAGRARQWDAVLVAASPVLFMHAFTNWDLAAVALTGLGLWAWSRGSPTWAGLALGLGIATKLYPLLVLIALLMLCVRAKKWRAGAKAIGGAVAAVVVAYIPAIVLSYQTPSAVYHSRFLFPQGCATAEPLRGWRWFLSLSQTRGGDWGSVWLVLRNVFSGDAFGRALGPGAHCGSAPFDLNVASALAVAFVVVAVAILVAAAPWRPRVGQIAFLLVAGFVMLNKIDSPQYALWLVPLAVLARPRWFSLLMWQVTEVVLGAANLYTLIAQAHSNQGLSMNAYLGVVVFRDLVLAGLMALVVREVLNPRHDIVRNDGVDDPAGGLLVTPLGTIEA